MRGKDAHHKTDKTTARKIMAQAQAGVFGLLEFVSIMSLL